MICSRDLPVQGCSIRNPHNSLILIVEVVGLGFLVLGIYWRRLAILTSRRSARVIS